jgi:hypothetical protein
MSWTISGHKMTIPLGLCESAMSAPVAEIIELSHTRVSDHTVGSPARIHELEKKGLLPKRK